MHHENVLEWMTRAKMGWYSGSQFRLTRYPQSRFTTLRIRIHLT